MGNSALMLSSMRTGATFSPPAVMRISCDCRRHTMEREQKEQSVNNQHEKDLCDVMDEVWKCIYIL